MPKRRTKSKKHIKEERAPRRISELTPARGRFLGRRPYVRVAKRIRYFIVAAVGFIAATLAIYDYLRPSLRIELTQVVSRQDRTGVIALRIKNEGHITVRDVEMLCTDWPNADFKHGHHIYWGMAHVLYSGDESIVQYCHFPVGKTLSEILSDRIGVSVVASPSLGKFTLSHQALSRSFFQPFLGYDNRSVYYESVPFSDGSWADELLRKEEAFARDHGYRNGLVPGPAFGD